jgi:hypothetical protein
MVDALASKDDEGRSLAAIRYGEVPNNRYIRRFPNGETLSLRVIICALDVQKYTLGSKTFQYQVENRTIVIS